MIETFSSRQNKFGFYQVGDLKTYSQLEAAQAHIKTNQPFQWNFNQEVYSSQNWTVEPTESLSELYRQRAQDLRDNYDYLVLWFSGGADSTNILNTFLDNNIKLDEVASYVNYEATRDKFNFLNAEIYNVAGPVVLKAKDRQPWLQHTVIDLSRLVMDFFQEKSTKFDWVYYVNKYANPSTVSRRNINLKVPHWRKMFDEGKRVAFISGIDKPRVSCINGKYYFRFVDAMDPAVSAVTQMDNNSWEFNELFYWDPSAPKIVIKQAHVIKQFLKTVQLPCQYLTTEKKSLGVVQTVIDKKLLWLTPNGLHRLIYPSWHPVPFQFKPSSLIMTQRDAWFFKMSDSEAAKYSWKVGIEHRWKNTPEFLRSDATDMKWGFKNISSIPYYLGT